MNRPWMPLYVADYLADTAHLNAAQSGAYLHLIMHYWQTGNLPGDDAALARIARMTGGEWRKSRAVIEPFFQDGWRHKRIDCELAHAEQVSSKRRAAAEQKHRNSSANAPANAEQMHTHARTCAGGLPSHSQSESKKDPSLRSGASGRGSRLEIGWQPSEADREYARLQGFVAREVDATAENFRDYWIAKAGKDGAKSDWPATWRRWVRTESERKNGNGTRKTSLSELAFDIADEARDRERQAGVFRQDEPVGGH